MDFSKLIPIKLRLTILFLAIALIPSFLIGILTFNNYKYSLEMERIATLRDIATFKTDKIELCFEGLKNNIRTLQDSSLFKKTLPVLNKFIKDTDNPEFIASRKMLDERLRSTQSILGLADIMLLNAEGKVIYSSNPEYYTKDFLRPLPDPQDKAFKKGKSSVYLTDIFLNEARNNKPEMLLAAPIPDPNGLLIGIVVFEIDMVPTYALVQDATGLGNTGETLICKRIGDEVIYLNTLKYDRSAALKRKLKFGSRIGIPAQRAAEGKKGSGYSIDYRGKKIIAAWTYISSLGWGMVVKVDTDEAFADVAVLRNLLILILAITAALSGIIAFFIAKTISDAREKLAAIAREWEVTFNSVPDLVAIYDKNYKIVRVNKSYADFFKMKPEDLIGKFCYMIVHGTNEPFIGCPHKKMMETKKSQIIETFEPRLNIYIEVSTSPIFNDIKEVIGTVHIIKDITARKKAEEGVRRLAAIVESTDEAIIGKDLNNIITSWNKGAERLYGYTEKEVLGKHISTVVPEEYIDDLYVLTQKVKDGQRVEHYETIRLKKDGSMIPVSLTLSPIKDSSGNIIGISTIVHDISERKRLEELLYKYNEELKKDVEEKTRELRESQDSLVRAEKLAVIGKLAATVAHELRNPLGVMKNVVYYLNMLELAKTNPDVKENLDIAATEIERSDKIIADLLDFSRSKKPMFRPENINMIVREVLDRIKVAPGIKVMLDLGADLPDIEVDALQMHQVFYNITKNALEAMENGGMFKIRTAVNVNFMEVSFSDTGVGISKDNLIKVCEPFFSTKTKGTGLGLSVCASLVEGHGGKIEIKSEDGKGATFTVKLPVKRG